MNTKNFPITSCSLLLLTAALWTSRFARVSYSHGITHLSVPGIDGERPLSTAEGEAICCSVKQRERLRGALLSAAILEPSLKSLKDGDFWVSSWPYSIASLKDSTSEDRERCMAIYCKSELQNIVDANRNTLLDTYDICIELSGNHSVTEVKNYIGRISKGEDIDPEDEIFVLEVIMSGAGRPG